METAIIWQFWSTTHSPFCFPCSIITIAFGPCPCPSAILSTFAFFVSPNESSAAIGSLPAVSTKMSGIVGVESR